jgi:hypothetical protein
MVRRSRRSGLGRQILGQRLPLAARGKHVENPAENLAHLDRSLPPAALGRWDQRADQSPFSVGQIRWVSEGRDDRRQHDVLASTFLANQTPKGITTNSFDSTSFRIGLELQLICVSYVG